MTAACQTSNVLTATVQSASAHSQCSFAGSGQVIDQGARLVDIALEDGSAFKLDGWKYISESFAEHTLHFIGLLSDGGVHSRIDQLLGFVRGAAKDGAKRIRVHILTVRAHCCSEKRSACPHVCYFIVWRRSAERDSTALACCLAVCCARTSLSFWAVRWARRVCSQRQYFWRLHTVPVAQRSLPLQSLPYYCNVTYCSVT